MSIKPCHDRVLVKVIKKDNKTDSGLYLPESAQSGESYHFGQVLQVGPGKMLENGTLSPVTAVKAGDDILFGQYAGTKIKIEDEEHVILKEEDILGICS